MSHATAEKQRASRKRLVGVLLTVIALLVAGGIWLVYGTNGTPPDSPVAQAAPSELAGDTKGPSPAPTNVSGDPGALPESARKSDNKPKDGIEAFKESQPSDWPTGPSTGCKYVRGQLSSYRMAAKEGGAEAVRNLIVPLGQLQTDNSVAKLGQKFDEVQRLWSTALAEFGTSGEGNADLRQADKVLGSILKTLPCS